jgi:pantetheine-phosphate adenylyltransferase
MRVVYAGSFDPFHEGHLDIVEQAAAMFEEVVVAVVANPGKADGSPLDDRAASIRAATAHIANTVVVTHVGLTAELAAAQSADALVRGVARDHRAEIEMAYANQIIGGIPTLLLPGRADSRAVSSSGIRAGLLGTQPAP